MKYQLGTGNATTWFACLNTAKLLSTLSVELCMPA